MRLLKAQIIGFVKEKKTIVAIVVFALVLAFMMGFGYAALQVSLVALSVLGMVEAGIAVMLHKVELWIHIVMILAQIIAGVIAGRVAVTLLCVLVYIGATAALWVFDLDD